MKITKEQLRQIIKEELDMVINPAETERFNRAKEEWDKKNQQLQKKLNATKTLEDFKAVLRDIQAHISMAPTKKVVEEQFDPDDDIFTATTGLRGLKVKDPFDKIFDFIDDVNDAAMEKMGITDKDMDDWQFSELANKVVKDAANEISPSGDISNDELLAILKDQMPQLVDDLISRHQNPKLEPVDADFSDPGDDELPTIGFRGNKKIITKGEQ